MKVIRGINTVGNFDNRARDKIGTRESDICSPNSGRTIMGRFSDSGRHTNDRVMAIEIHDEPTEILADDPHEARFMRDTEASTGILSFWIV